MCVVDFQAALPEYWEIGEFVVFILFLFYFNLSVFPRGLRYVVALEELYAWIEAQHSV